MIRIIILLVSLAALASSAKPPKTWKICKKSDKNFQACTGAAVEGAMAGLMNGNPQLGIGKLEPMRFNLMVVDQGTGPVNVKLTFRNLDIVGLSHMKFKRSFVDWDKYHLESDIDFKENILLLGDYSINGKVLILPITGSGKCNLTFDGLSAKIIFTGHELIKNKQKYFEVDKVDLKLKAKNSYYLLTNLFNGDKALGDNMNVFLNENSKDIFNELEPAISRGLAAGFKVVTKQVFSKIPLNLLYNP